MKKIALTFDDGPNPKNTPKILDILKEMDVKATFFVIGKYVHEYPNIVRRIHNDGHLIGNHTYSHTDDFGKCSISISKVTGKVPRFVRVPYLDKNILKKCRHLLGKMVVVGASDISYDWKDIPASKIIKNVMKDVKDKSIVLLHDGDDKRDLSRSDALVEALPTIIQRLTADWFKLVRIDDRGFMDGNPSIEVIE